MLRATCRTLQIIVLALATGLWPVLMSMILLRFPTRVRYLDGIEAEMRRGEEKLNG